MLMAVYDVDALGPPLADSSGGGTPRLAPPLASGLVTTTMLRGVDSCSDVH